MSKFSQRKRRWSHAAESTGVVYPTPVLVGGYPAPSVKLTWDLPPISADETRIQLRELGGEWNTEDTVGGEDTEWVDGSRVQGEHHQTEYRIAWVFGEAEGPVSNVVAYMVMSGP